MKSSKRILSLLLAVVMMIGILPLNAFAATGDGVISGPSTLQQGGSGSYSVNTIEGEPNAQDITVTGWGITGGGSGITIDGSGTVTVSKTASTGSFTVTVSGTYIEGGVLDSFAGSTTVTVTAGTPSVTSVSVSPASTTITAGTTQTVQFTATVTGDFLTDTGVTWEVVNGTGFSAISTAGVLTVGAGETASSVTVKATANADSSKSATATVTLTSASSVSSVTVSPASATVVKGNSQALAATVNGTNLTNSNVTWAIIGGTGLSTLSTTSAGTSTTLNVGATETASTIIVRATSVQDTTKYKDVVITVSGTKTVTSITLSPTSATVATGNTKTFVATVHYSDGSEVEATSSNGLVKWTVEDNNKSGTSVTSAGKVTVGSSETADHFYVRATSTEKTSISKTAKITVSDNDGDKLTFSSVSRSGNYITGYVKADGSKVKSATVKFYDVSDSTSSYYKSATTDSDGYFSINIGSLSVSSSDYLVASKSGYTTSSKYYLSSSTNSDSTSSRTRIYPSSISRTNGGDTITGTISSYPNSTVYIYYDGSQIGSGSTNSNGYFSISVSRTVSSSMLDDLKFYVSSTSTSNRTQVYPTDKSLSSSGYTVSGYLTNYTNTTVYVYYDGSQIGSGTTNSSGYFSISLSRKISSVSDLKFYVASSSNKTTTPAITTAYAGTNTVSGTAEAGATITVKNSSGTTLGTATVATNGTFTVTTNRTLTLNEVLTIVASKSGKNDSSITYTVSKTQGAELKRTAYITGYLDGTFKPNKDMTRAEAAAMFARLLNGSSNFSTSSTTKFSDANNAWYSQAINYVVDKGLISGYTDGTFKPEQKITRAEFAQMISGYITTGVPSTNTNLTDINDSWAKEAIEKLYGNQIISGYPDGTFKPNAEITRAEAVTILNSTFGIVADSNSYSGLSGLKSFSDVKSSDWYYVNVMAASNSYESNRKSSTDNTEVWTKINN